MSKYFIKAAQKSQYTVTKDSKFITTGDLNEACRKFIHFNSIIGQRRATDAELAYWNQLSEHEKEINYPVGIEIEL